jgi:hypothetical protein
VFLTSVGSTAREGAAVRRRLVLGGGVVVLVVGLGLAAVHDTRAATDWDLDDNGLPDVCVGGPYTFKFLGVRPAPTAGEFDWEYRLETNAAARKKVNRIVLTVNRGVAPSDIVGASTQGASVGIQTSKFGDGDTSTKVGFAIYDVFTAAITPKVDTSLAIPFSVRSRVGTGGLISIGVDTGTGGFIGCASNPEDAVAGPTSIEGPAVAEVTVDPNSAIAASTIYSSSSNVCPVEVGRDGAGSITFVRFTAEALANGCNPEHILVVPQSEISIVFQGFSLPLHFTGDGFEGNGPILLGSTDKCLRIWDKNCGCFYLVSTTGTSRNGCTT